MKGWLSLLLLFGALLGVFGQGVALASSPAMQSAQAVSVAGEPDCKEMMQQDPDGQPCKGITLDCIAAMGCVVPFTLTKEQPALATPVLQAVIPPTALIARLSGRVPSPEPEPPTS